MALADTLQASWYGTRGAPLWTYPLAWLYGALTALRRGLYRIGWLRSTTLPVPVVVVGNITAGGTGKTPLTLALVHALTARGWRPGVVSRGYGGTQREPALLDDRPDPARYGDEPCLIRASGVPVAVGGDRPAATALLLQAGCNVVIADDGLQHYALARDVEICVVDGARRFGNGRLLPAGPLREPLSRLRQVDFLVCNGEAGEGEYPMHLAGGTAVSLTEGATRPLSDFGGQTVHAVAAIGHPERFFQSLRAQGLTIIGHVFADHHAFVPQDLAVAGDAPLLMTDKDAIKCQSFARPGWWRVPVRAVLDDDFIVALCRRLDEAAGRLPAAR
ncbi:tetraacyldisaccharide 4'-kinase [Dyella sp.]|uniref:tetraacyldisaccharide 4'-kinase n=1 Tax=Dyella sp. TaxID=1869338 RepID=UPI003F80F63A